MNKRGCSLATNTSGIVGMLFREVFGNAGTLLGDSPVSIQQETEIVGNSDTGGEEVIDGSCIISTPDLSDYYPEVWEDGRTRVGERQLEPPIKLPKSLHWSGNLSQLRVGRRRRPELPWGKFRFGSPDSWSCGGGKWAHSERSLGL